MTADRGITIGRDAFGNVLVTGDNNLTFVLIGTNSVPEELLAALRAGRIKPAELPGAVPLPALTLNISFVDTARLQWQIAARRATDEEPQLRIDAVPWQQDAALEFALATFASLARNPVETRDDHARLDAVAWQIGEALAGVLSADEMAFLIAVGRGDPPPPLLVVESDDDQVLALPWELLRLEGRFAVQENWLDVARSVPSDQAPVLSPPTSPFSLLVNVSAPQGSRLDYERESYLIVRALHEHFGVVINEMGEVGDLAAGLRTTPPPIGVHFSGHGRQGALIFEDEFGEAKPVAVDQLVSDIRHRAERLPRFFYLSCCHGGDTQVSDGVEPSAPAVATVLHRDGIAQVVGYFGPVLDEASTRAEQAFYAQLAYGRRTRDAVRVARRALSEPLVVKAFPYAWAQIVLYQRGPDYPLGIPIASAESISIETTERWTEKAYPGSRTQVLKAGFVGRRKEMHELRRDLRAGRNFHVVFGAGGLGKSAFCIEALKVYARLGWQPIALWCADVETSADPVSDLVRQLEANGSPLLGEAWDEILARYETEAKQRAELRQPADRFHFLLQALVQASAKPLAVYLDGLESLQSGPDSDDPAVFAEWRDGACAAFWQGLRQLQERFSGRLAVLGSSRYRHRDFGAGVPFTRLATDALWRMMLWFPNLRRLSEASRAGLVERLAGHPRSVEFLDALIGAAIFEWEYENGPFSPGCLSPGEEQAQIIAAVLPRLDVQLSEDLLFDALWDRVLDPPSRDLLVRAGVLRRPGSLELITALTDDDKEPIARLRTTGLLSEIREAKPGSKAVSTFEVHPTIVRLAQRRSNCATQLAEEGHRRAGGFYAELAAHSPNWQNNLEAAYHLRQVDEADRAFELVTPLMEWLKQRGRFQELLLVLKEFGDLRGLHSGRQAWALTYQADALKVYGDLPQALDLYNASLRLREQLETEEPDTPEWQRDLSVSHERIGDVRVAQGQLDAALTAYQAAVAIAERLTAAHPANAEWQRDLSLSYSRIGDIQVAQGQLNAALTAFQADLAIAERLAAVNPANAEWQRDLSISHNRIGEVRVAQGQLEVALTAFQTAYAIVERLAAADRANSQWQRDLALCHEKIGNARLVQGQLDAALTAFRASLAIRERLTTADPANTDWQRDLSISHERVGDVRVRPGPP